MKIVKPKYRILETISDGGLNELKLLEEVARVCYKSEGNITEDGESAKRLLKNLINAGHEAMLEHRIITVKFICDRGISHEIVRHRIASFAQESTRYCNYSKDKFGNEITVIKPFFYSPTDTSDIEELEKQREQHFEVINELFDAWVEGCEFAEKSYFNLLDLGSTPQEARSVLPTSLKTELVMTANYREWRHFFTLRTASAAHPQIRELAIPLLKELQSKIPIIFDDIEVV